MSEISVTKTLSIRDCKQNEFWLRDLICDNPSVLGLGPLQAVMKEKTQSSGGRLDLLLKNPEDDSMFEVEVQLGATDESHIIRTLEYWDREKRRWPKRSHTAVLVAEVINSRFFNVVQLLSSAVPIIGIQANIIEMNGLQGIHFTKIIDTYEEPEEDEGNQKAYDEKHWTDKFPWVLDCAKWYCELLTKLYGDVQVKYFESYISMSIGGAARVWVNQRKKDRAFIEVKVGDEVTDEVQEFVTEKGGGFRSRGLSHVNFNVNLKELQDGIEEHQWLASRISLKHLKPAGGAVAPT